MFYIMAVPLRRGGGGVIREKRTFFPTAVKLEGGVGIVVKALIGLHAS